MMVQQFLDATAITYSIPHAARFFGEYLRGWGFRVEIRGFTLVAFDATPFDLMFLSDLWCKGDYNGGG